jgi:hypothetical protein
VRRAASGGYFRELLGCQAGLRSGAAFVPGAAIRSDDAARARFAVAVEVAATGALATIPVAHRGPGAAVAHGRTRATVGATIPVAHRGPGAAVAGRGAVAPGRARATVAGRGAVAPEVTIRARSVISVVNRGGERNLGSSLTLRGGATERGARRSEDSGGLGAHAQDAPAARGQDLEIELVEAHSKFFSGPAQSLFHRFAGELAVSVAIGSHVSVVSLAGPRVYAYSGEQLRPPMPSALPAVAGWRPVTCLHSLARAS